MIHGGQFAILKHAVKREGYQAVQLEDGWVLSYHPKLPVHVDPSRKLILLGYAWQVDPDKGTPVEEINKLQLTSDGVLPEKELLAAEETWCGRYALISNGVVHTDTCALLAIFYSDAGVSSDFSILAEEAGREPMIYQPTKLMNWFPAPLTPYDEVRRLLPSQLYDYHQKKVTGRQLLAQTWKEKWSEDKLISEFTRLFCASLKNMRALLPDKQLLVALTGGYDSRTLFAMMVRAGLDFECYTLQHQRISVGDVNIPPELCRKTNIRHTYYPRNPANFSEARLQEFMTHISGLVWETDRMFYADGLYQQVIEKYGDVVFLRSGVYECVQEYFRRFVSSPFNRQEIIDHYELPEGSRERKSLNEYFDWCEKNPQGITDCNRFNWELMSGCWLGCTEQSFDIYDRALSFHPVNCRLLLTILHAFPVEERQEKYHQAKISAYACPAIADVPYGSNKAQADSYAAIAAQKVKKAVNRLRKNGLRGTLKIYGRIFGDMRQSSRFSKKK